MAAETPVTAGTPFVLPCGVRLENRLAKAAMTECLADPLDCEPLHEHAVLYAKWAAGGLGMSITGNVMVDGRYLEAPGNVVLEDDSAMAAFSAWALAAKGGVNGRVCAVMQISHAGRQTPASITRQPVAPSAVPIELPGLGPLSGLLHARPRALTGAEVADVVQRFARTALLAKQAGFSGVQVHSAHGYLLSQFLSPKVNRRTDEWGGTPVKRRRLLLEVLRAVRANVGPQFVVGVKLNSSDFQHGGMTREESVDVMRMLARGGEEGEGGQLLVDFVEISGGTYENMRSLQNEDEAGAMKASTRAREGFFIEFAEMAREHVGAALPLMVTGGFRSAAGINAALATGAVDLVGMARPLCMEYDLPRRITTDVSTRAKPYRMRVGVLDAILVPALSSLWHIRQMHCVARGEEPAPHSSSGMAGLFVMLVRRALWEPRRSRFWRWWSWPKLALVLALLFSVLCWWRR